MSAVNGDKARFNRVRRQKIARRIRNRKLLKGTISAAVEAAVPSPESVPATKPSRNPAL